MALAREHRRLPHLATIYAALIDSDMAGKPYFTGGISGSFDMRVVATKVMTLSLLLAGCASQSIQVPPSATRLDSAALRALVVDMTVSGISVTSGQPYVSYFAPDGTVRMESGTSFRDSGRCRITDDGRLCTTYQAFRAGQESCGTYFRDGTTLFRIADDGRTFEVKDQFKQGNASRL